MSYVYFLFTVEFLDKLLSVADRGLLRVRINDLTDADFDERYAAPLRAGFLRELKITAVYVTHDRVEALVLSDLVAVMRTGTVTPKAKLPKLSVFTDSHGTLFWVEAVVRSGATALKRSVCVPPLAGRKKSARCGTVPPTAIVTVTV